MRIVIRAVIWVFPLAGSRGMQFVLRRLPIVLAVKLAVPRHVSRSDVWFGLGCTATNGFSACTATLVPSLLL
jgi:hypothetical protein